MPTALTPPRIQDIQGLTVPRLGALFEVDEASTEPLAFRIPVDDEGVTDPIQFQFFINSDRDCVPRDGGPSCEPGPRLGEVPADGTTRRFVTRSFAISSLQPYCNRIDLYVSSAFRLDGNFHTPVRDGDVDFRTWWVFVRPSVATATDGGVSDPVMLCPFLLQP